MDLYNIEIGKGDSIMYDLILRDVETVFGSSAWTVNNIKTYPTNYL